MKTELRNTFHNTWAYTRYTPEELDRIANTPSYERTPAEKSLVRRLHDKLCGSSDCTCGNSLGERY